MTHFTWPLVDRTALAVKRERLCKRIFVLLGCDYLISNRFIFSVDFVCVVIYVKEGLLSLTDEFKS